MQVDEHLIRSIYKMVNNLTEEVKHQRLLIGQGLYSPQEFAAKTGLSEITIIKCCKNGELAAEKIGGSWRIPCSEYDRIIRSAMSNLTNLDVNHTKRNKILLAKLNIIS